MTKGVRRVKKINKSVPADQIDQYLAAAAAKRQFIVSAVNMGWQLGLIIIVPVMIGVKLDDHFHTSPSYTLAALVLAVMGACLVVWQTITQVNRQQKESKKS